MRVTVQRVTFWMLWAYAIYGIACADSYKSQVFEEIGVALTSDGFVGNLGEEMYVSMFLKLESPLLRVNACNSPCGLVKGVLEDMIAKSNCKNQGRTGNGEILKKISLTPVNPADTLVAKCVAACLEEDLCVGVNAISVPGIQSCILRSTVFTTLTQGPFSKAEIVMACLINDKERFCRDNLNPIMGAFNKRNNETLSRIWRRYTEAIEVIRRVTSFKVDSGKSDARPKRLWGAMAPLAGIFVSGLSLYESFKVSEHVRKLGGEFKEFVKEEVLYKERQLLIEKETIRILGGLARDMERLEEEMRCEVRQLASQMFKVQRIEEFETFISNLFDPVAQNRMEGPASLKILDTAMLTKIAKSDHLKGTIYQTNPELITLGRLILVDAAENGDAFSCHLILALPELRADTIFPLYKTHAVSFTTPTMEQCGKVKMASHVINKRGVWVAVNPDACAARGQVKLCTTVEDVPEPCLDKDPGAFEECQIFGTKCLTEIVELPSGVLVNSRTPVEAVRRNESKLRGVKRKAYYSYTVFKSLVVDRRIIQALDFPVRELMWSPPTTLKDISFLDEKIVNNPDLGRMRTLVMDQEEHVQLSLWTTAMAWVGAGGWLLWAGCWILVWMERWTGGWAGLRVWMEECWSRRSWKEVEVELSEEEQED